MTFVTIIGLLALLPLAIVDCVFLAEVLFGLVRPRREAEHVGPSPSIAILVPAHDEEQTLSAAGEMLRRIAAIGARVIVVADNCSDGTASIAATLGCEIVERQDPERRGKGYALAAGRYHLAGDPPDIVIVLDADCSMSASAVALLAARAAAHDRVIQAAYLFRYDPLASPKVQISNFAFAVKNLIRQRGARRLGAAAILVGSGMAFPWRLFAALDLATGNVVEDLALGIDLVRRNEPPFFEEAAEVWSDASNGAGTETQRARWEGGFITTARQFAWPLIVEGLKRHEWKHFCLGVHLLVPPLTLVLMLNIVFFLLFAFLAVMGLPIIPVLYSVALLFLIVSAVALAWIVEGRRHMPARMFPQIPVYLAWKAIMHLRLATGRRAVAWIRTERAQRDQGAL
jgi:cellulose synthase/poly-beta-1,6-N-acetylglucosamine synthase-like glycosyltransferase